MNNFKKMNDNLTTNDSNEAESPTLLVGAISGSQICPNCEKEHDCDEWNGYCSKTCWWGFPIDCH